MLIFNKKSLVISSLITTSLTDLKVASLVFKQFLTAASSHNRFLNAAGVYNLLPIFR
jgi:hypothetical protein